jgi:ribonuclease BN (tRNA processing enzyme)
LQQLLTQIDDGAVDAVIVTHEHPDHCVDLHGLFRVRRYSYPQEPKIPLYCPAGVLDRLSGLEPDVDLGEVFEHRPLPGRYDVGPFAITGERLPHFVPTVGIRLVGNGVVIGYATDTGPCETLADIGRDADLYILDATDRPGELDAAERNLLTASEAGEWAQRAGAKRLLLTHLWPGTQPAGSAVRAQRMFDGPVQVAHRGLVIDLPT